MNAKLFAAAATVSVALLSGCASVNPGAGSPAPTTPVPTITATAMPTPTPVVTPSTFTIRGAVTDASSGRPLAGVRVFVYAWIPDFCHSFTTPQPRPVQQLTTQGDGSYRSGSLPAGIYLLRTLSGPGDSYVGQWWKDHDCETADQVALKGDATINFALKPSP